MKKLLIATALVTAALGTTVSFADEMLFGRTEFGVISAIEDQGYKVVSANEWGTLVRVSIIDENGRETMALFDADTLKLVKTL